MNRIAFLNGIVNNKSGVAAGRAFALLSRLAARVAGLPPRPSVPRWSVELLDGRRQVVAARSGGQAMARLRHWRERADCAGYRLAA